ncbi:MAG: hypothetical protein M1816_000361 [Peltula sp. TS41687]|nr:MAG: hypothetical protein M1816_000361 [Peltula sp. TS41687]
MDIQMNNGRANNWLKAAMYQPRYGQNNQWYGNQQELRRIEAPNRPLQITSSDTRNGSNQQNCTTAPQPGYQNQGRPWLNRPNNGQLRPYPNRPSNSGQPVRAYHGDTMDDPYDESADYHLDTPYDEQQDYEAYEGEFFGDVYWTGRAEDAQGETEGSIERR